MSDLVMILSEPLTPEEGQTCGCDGCEGEGVVELTGLRPWGEEDLRGVWCPACEAAWRAAHPAPRELRWDPEAGAWVEVAR